ncbi:MAG TPA: hypothetical protein VEU30_08480 [Thermoanaerobaculia bacterium]|nr:hypothetical protein [Thermoanaerobaculia bacterium]
MEAEKSPWWTKLDAGTITGVLALIFSMYSIVVANRQYSDSEGTALINQTYATYEDINAKRREMVEISHLVCTPEQYPRVQALVRAAAASMDASQRAEAQLRESAMAMFLFAQFEQTLYLHQKAVELGESERVTFTEGTLDYFTGTLLRNPRLVHMWSPSGDNLRAYHDPMAQKYWDAKVGPAKPRADAVGPFAPQ